MPTAFECPRCLKVGVHSRVKRLYYRLVGRYSEVGWICPSCLHYTPDYQALVNDYNEIFGTQFTESDFRQNVFWINERISFEEIGESAKQKLISKKISKYDGKSVADLIKKEKRAAQKAKKQQKNENIADIEDEIRDLKKFKEELKLEGKSDPDIENRLTELESTLRALSPTFSRNPH